MRNSCFKAVVLGLALAGWALGSATQSQAQTNLLVPFTSYWRYNDSGTSLDGSNWMSPTNYNDSGWKPTGAGTASRALFGYETDNRDLYEQYGINTPLFRFLGGASSGTQVLTYYFRGGFNFNLGNPNQYFLIASNLIDDGAVVYLNGQELYRYNMPGGTVNYNTSASGAAPEGVMNVVVIPMAPMLKSGTNVLAVELHQSGTTSSDAVFGMSLAAVRLTPLSAIPGQQPPSLTITNIGARFSLSFGVTGSYPQYQWFKNGTAISGANQPTLTFNSVVTNNTGTYTCVVSNGLNSLTCTPAFLQVVQDTFPPVPMSALVREIDTNRTITLSFNEAVLAPPSAHALWRISAVNPTNYALYRYTPDYKFDSTTLVPLATNGFFQGSIDGFPAIRIPVATDLDPKLDYVLKIRNVCDSKTNLLTNWHIGVSFAYTTNLFQMEEVWDYTFYDQSATFAAGSTNWTTNTFIPNWDWGQGSGPLFYSPEGMETCFGRYQNIGAPNGTVVSTWSDATFYFRNKFTVPQNTSVTLATVRLQHLIDDGAIFYLNGREIPGSRFNMPDGPPSYGTPTLSNVEVACRTNNIIVTNLLRTGENVIAAEVHQWPESSGFDIFFGANMDLSVTTLPQVLTNNHQDPLKIVTNAPVAPTITAQPQSVTVKAGTNVSFNVTATGGDSPLSYQWRRNGTNIAGATASTYTLTNVQVSLSGSQFNVVVANNMGSVTSLVATLTVTNAGTAPVLILQPQSQTVGVGQSVAFSAIATGSTPLLYMWRVNETPVTGFTVLRTNFQIASVTMATNNSRISVVVSNSYGVVTSVNATLTVTNTVTTPTNPGKMWIQRTNSGAIRQVLITWTNSAAKLQQTTNLHSSGNTFADIASNPSNVYVAPISTTNRFYRLAPR